MFGFTFISNLGEADHQTHLRLARGARNAAEIMATRSKIRLRQDVLQGGLGQRVANTWRADIYPKSASARTHAPAVMVYTKAPMIMQAFDDAPLIRSKNGTFLAIPTDNTPNKGKKPATPVEVEAMFNQDLIFKPSRNGNLLAFVNVMRAKSGKGFRRATKGRLAQGRKPKLVLMFVMVRQVQLRKRINSRRTLEQLGREWPDIYAAEATKAIENGSN